MNIVLNGEALERPEGTTVADLVREGASGAQRIAVELNGEIVPRSLHAVRVVAAGDRVEIVRAIGGG